MEALGWIIINVFLIGGFFFLLKWLLKPTDDQLRSQALHKSMVEELYYKNLPSIIILMMAIMACPKKKRLRKCEKISRIQEQKFCVYTLGNMIIWSVNLNEEIRIF